MANNIEHTLALTRIEALLEEIKDLLLNMQVERKPFDTKKLCEYLGVGKKVIDDYKRSGELNYSKLGKKIVFKPSDVDELLRRTSVNYIGV